MKPIEITKGIYWVGTIDWNIRDFHGYSTYQGTTYNAYLIIDEKITLIDTVKKEFADELIHNIGRILDPKKIDYVISNHTEMDHSGGLPRVMHRIGEDKPLFCSKVGYKNLSMHFPQKWNYNPLENGGKLSLGERTLTFLETRMLHWPDSMFTYAVEDKILFSSDAFGQHLAGLERYDDQMGDAIMPHAKKYFANILLLYAPLVLKLVEKVTDMVQQIATSTEEQSAASEEISSNVEAVSTVAKETATGMEQSNNAIQDLSKLATELKDIVGLFKLKEEEKIAAEAEEA